MPCLDTTGDSIISIQLAGDDASQPQQVYGRFTSWDPQTTTIGFKSDLSHKMEQIPIRFIRFEPSRPNPVAQASIPTLEMLGAISRSYPACALSVIEGVLKLPGCCLKYGGNELVFEGTLTFSGGDVRIEGNVFKVVPHSGGGGDSTLPKGG